MDLYKLHGYASEKNIDIPETEEYFLDYEETPPHPSLNKISNFLPNYRGEALLRFRKVITINRDREVLLAKIYEKSFFLSFSYEF